MTHLVTNPRHLYRSLLRECSYLFDSNARTFCHNHIVSSFRRHVKPQILGKTLVDTSRLPSKDESRRLKRGRKFLYMLERANEGYIYPLEKVLKLAYARKGKRRRQMLQKFMIPEPGNDIVEGPQVVIDMSERNWSPPSGFVTLTRAQAQVQAQLDRIRNVKPSPRIPEKNKWGRPMPRRRIRNQNKKWYARNAACLLPPLPDTEWQEIHALSLGSSLESKKAVKLKRPKGTVGVLAPVVKPSQVESDNFAVFLADGVQKDFDPRMRNDNSQSTKVQRPHKLTPRFLRRRITRSVLRYTPLALVLDNGKRTVYRWEEGVVNRKLAKTVNKSQINLLFD